MSAILSMAKMIAPGHDGLPIKFFQRFWLTIGPGFRQMLTRGMENMVLHEGVTKGLISLIPNNRDIKDLNY